MPAAKAAPVRHLCTMKELAEQAEQGVGPELTLVETPSGQRLTYLEFTRIRPFAGHPFRLYTGERLSDMVESIRKNGILTPLIVRRIYDDPDYDYEMLSGHSRMNAGILAGVAGALCLVKGEISHSEALMYVIGRCSPRASAMILSGNLNAWKGMIPQIPVETVSTG